MDINTYADDAYEAVCECGWASGALPDEGSALDAHAEHQEEEGA